MLERLAEYMMDNSGNLNSTNNIANVLDANRVPTNHVTVGRYISYLRDAFVFYEARRYDIKGKKYLSTQAKHYVCDSGMRYAVLGTRDMDWGRMYENAVFLELMRRGYETYVGKLYQKEVDFVAKRGSELVYIQVSDDISSESTLKNMRTEESERLGTLLYLDGKTQTPCKDVLGPGAIIAVGKLKNTRTGDTLSDDKAPFAVAMPQLAPQLITFALAPKEKGDEDKVYAAVQKLLDEDVTLKLSRDEESGDILLSGMGQLHIETAVERAKRRYKVEILLKTPKVPYRETVRGKVQVQGRHKKQSGGRGQFGDCWIEMEGLPRGSGYVFEDAIVGGAIPRNYIPAIDKGVQESAARGFIAGCPVVDFKVRLYDGSYHTVDSSEMAFKVAGSLAFKKAIESLKPVLLEPIVLLCVSVPDEYMGDVIGDLSSRRGKVLGSDSQVGITEIKAHIPMSEVLRYAPDLRSITGGQGVFTMEFDHYEEAPQPIVDKVIAEHQKAKAEE